VIMMLAVVVDGSGCFWNAAPTNTGLMERVPGQIMGIAKRTLRAEPCVGANFKPGVSNHVDKHTTPAST